MFQKFNDNNIESKFIKSILRNTYIPSLQVWKPGKPIIAGFTYVTKDFLVTAIKDWDSSMGTGPESSTDINYFKVIEPYVEGNFYKGVTSNYTSNVSGYDSETHKYLGNYLRMVRDLYGIDLLPYYNCWNNSYTDLIRLKRTNNTISLMSYTETQNDGYKVLMVPIKFNTSYTIYINSDTPILIGSTYIDDNNRLLNLDTPKLYNTQKINSLSYQSPYLYSGVKAVGSVSPNYDKDKNPRASTNYYLEEYLTLLIQISENNNSSILVLEGDFTGNKLYMDNKLTQVFFGKNTELTEEDYNKQFTSPSSLTRNISTTTYAFNDRLIEYLLLNVIDKNETISKNIERVQNYIGSYKSLQVFGNKYSITTSDTGIWDNEMRTYIYNLVTQVYKYPLSVDINGFVDKDTEKIILRGKS